MMSAGFGIKGQARTHQRARPATSGAPKQNGELHARAFDRIAQPVGGGKFAAAALVLVAALIGVMSAAL